MNLELFIARRLLKGDGAKAVSVPIVRIALVGIALGVCVMLLSIFIITGFKNEIVHKLSGFSAHLNVVSYAANDDFNGDGIRASDTLLNDIRKVPEVTRVYRYIRKPAILKSHSEIHGVELRGMDSTYNRDFFKQHLKRGELPDYNTANASGDILLSADVASLLGVDVGGRVDAHFVQQPPRVRPFTVKGIYDTGFLEYDDILVVCDMRHLQRLNGWEGNEVSGIAVELEDIEQMEEAKAAIDGLLPWNNDNTFYQIKTLQDMAPQIFDWMNLLDMNVWIILILIILVAGVNMISGLLILILDKTALIGILKALGYKNVKLRRLFLYIAAGLIGRGILWGNGLALLLALLQQQFKIISLDPTSYYMDTVPVNISWVYILLLNVGVLFVSVLMLVLPTMLISKIQPIKAIRFE